ncbi:MAG: hypothetical protein CK425_10475 [Parachlamydia sp.]|nr:MAG: hypothetical protein CK425_10475 [Parachlamydia sp.]
MKDLSHLVRNYTVKHERTIKRICKPLQDLNISDLGYARIKTDGSFCNFNTFPALLEYFYAEKMYQSQPYFCCPDLFHSGYTLTQVSSISSLQKTCEARYGINHSLCKVERHQDYMELFSFHPPINQSTDCLNYLNCIHLLDKFAAYFRQEARTLITNAMNEGYNLLKSKGSAFYEASPNLDLLSNDFKAQQFIKKISPLTVREHQCLDLFKEGRSAQATAAILNLSQRTVEHYFDNIKSKLGCQSKRELLEIS